MLYTPMCPPAYEGLDVVYRSVLPHVGAVVEARAVRRHGGYSSSHKSEAELTPQTIVARLTMFSHEVVKISGIWLGLSMPLKAQGVVDIGDNLSRSRSHRSRSDKPSAPPIILWLVRCRILITCDIRDLRPPLCDLAPRPGIRVEPWELRWRRARGIQCENPSSIRPACKHP